MNFGKMPIFANTNSKKRRNYQANLQYQSEASKSKENCEKMGKQKLKGRLTRASCSIEGTPVAFHKN